MGADFSQFGDIGVTAKVKVEGEKEFDDILKRLEASMAQFAASVDKFAKAVEQADGRIAQSAKKTADEVEKANDRQERSRQRSADLQIGLSVAQQNYKQALQQIQAELAMTAQGTDRFTQLQIRQAQVERQLEEQNNSLGASLSKFRRAWFDIIAAIGIVAVAVKGAIEAFKALEEAAQMEGMIKASSRMAQYYGANMTQIMRDLDEASNYTLAAADKFRLVNEALLAGGEDVATKLPELVKIARAAAIASGNDFETVLNKLLLGIARTSPRLIDDARIYLKVGDVIKQYADAHGIAEDAIDEHTKQMIVLEAVLKDGQRVIEAVGDEAVQSGDAFKRMESDATDAFNAIKVAAFELLNSANLVTDAFETLDAIIKAGLVKMAIYAGQAAYLLNLIQTWNTQSANENMLRTTLNVLAAGGLATTTEPAIPEDKWDKERRRLEIAAAAQDALLAKEKEYQKKYDELIIEYGKKALDAQTDYDRQREEAATDHERKMYDIAIDGIRKREDLGIDLGRKLEDADIEYNRAIEDANQEHNDKLIDIEEKYQDKIREIDRKFEDDLWNAIKTRDAMGLIEAMRTRERGYQDAAHDRDREYSDEDRNNENRLRDARRNLDRKREDAQRSYERELDDQRRAEDRARQDEKLAWDRRKADLKTAFDQRIADLRRQWAQELAETGAQYKQQEDNYRNHLQMMRAIAAVFGIGSSDPAFKQGGTNEPRRRAEGGLDIVSSPTTFMVGEGGQPELVYVAPLGGNRDVTVPSNISHLFSGSVDHRVNATIQSSIYGMEGRLTAAMGRVILQILGGRR